MDAIKQKEHYGFAAWPLDKVHVIFVQLCAYRRSLFLLYKS